MYGTRPSARVLGRKGMRTPEVEPGPLAGQDPRMRSPLSTTVHMITSRDRDAPTYHTQ